MRGRRRNVISREVMIAIELMACRMKRRIRGEELKGKRCGGRA